MRVLKELEVRNCRVYVKGLFSMVSFGVRMLLFLLDRKISTRDCCLLKLLGERGRIY